MQAAAGLEALHEHQALLDAPGDGREGTQREVVRLRSSSARRMGGLGGFIGRRPRTR